MYYVKGTETAHFSPKTEIGPHGTVWAPRSQLLALGTSHGWVLLIMQLNVHCPPKMGFQILNHLTGFLSGVLPKRLLLIWENGSSIVWVPGNHKLLLTIESHILLDTANCINGWALKGMGFYSRLGLHSIGYGTPFNGAGKVTKQDLKHSLKIMRKYGNKNKND